MCGHGNKLHYFFIASAVKKPMVQVLIKGFEQVSEDGSCRVLMFQPNSNGVLCNMPAFCTGHQAFQEVCLEWLVDGRPLPEKLGVWVCEYDMNPFQPLLSATNVRKGNFLEFSKGSQKPRKPVKPKLPFGFQRRKRKRKPNRPAGSSKKVAGTSGSNRRSLNVTLNEIFAENQGKGDGQGGGRQRDHDDPNNYRLDDDSDVGSGPLQSSSSSSDTDIACNEDIHVAGEKVAEQLMRPQDAKEEERRTKQLHADREVRIQKAASKTPADVQPPQKSKTFCNANLGIVDVGVQISGRLAGCRHCLAKIAKGSTRFAYAYSRVKFHSWLHKDCVVPHLVQENADLGQAREFLSSFLTRAGIPESVREASKVMERLVASEAGQASSTGH